jgi:hypothetical protein
MGDSPDPPPKTLTVSEANALLPTVRPLLQQLQGLQRSIVQTNQRLDELVGKLATGNGYPIHAIKQHVQELTKHQLQLIEAFQSALQQLEILGCMLKDLDIGLVDFYSLRDGKLVFLCWKLEEERIRFWHSLEEGYAGRHPLDAG